MSINTEFNNQVSRIFDPLRDKCLSLLEVGDLVMLSRTCKVFRGLVKGDSKSNKLIELFMKFGHEFLKNTLPTKNFFSFDGVDTNDMITWANQKGAKPTVNPMEIAFFKISDRDLAMSACVTTFTWQTVVNVASHLRTNGNTPIPSHSAGAIQPKELTPFKYISSIDIQSENPKENIFYQIWKQHQVANKLYQDGIDPQYGEKAFYDREGFSSTPNEKAFAILMATFFKISNELTAFQNYYADYKIRLKNGTKMSENGPAIENEWAIVSSDNPIINIIDEFYTAEETSKKRKFEEVQESEVTEESSKKQQLEKTE